ncbi:unnamed protein product [Adineta steineri]|uniref:Uncharacterized protein n=1 Tax=Adineta steineri TaxID=433720 RepID=A0A820GGP7_9BILA|nr:unnamed protein product [Adineta steineri]
MLPYGYVKKRATQSVTNRQTTASCLQQAMGAPKSSIAVTTISSAKATSAKGRRRRNIQCDKTDRSGIAIVFDIGLNYPSDSECHTPNCKINLFTSIHEKFNTVSNVNITADDGSNIPVELCHVQSYLNGKNNNDKIDNGIIVGKQSICFITYSGALMHSRSANQYHIIRIERQHSNLDAKPITNPKSKF